MKYVRDTLAIERIQRILDKVAPEARSRVIGFVYDQEISRKPTEAVPHGIGAEFPTDAD